MVPYYSTTCRCLNDLEVRLDPVIDTGKPVTIAVDSSGIKVGDRGEWMRQKWRRRRGFLKFHLAVDVESKQIVALVVTDERTGDSPMLIPLVEQAGRVNLILDFRNVQFLSSAVLGLLIRVSKKVYEGDGQLRLCNIQSKIHEIFKITRLTKIFDIYPDLEGAIEGLSESEEL